MRRTSAAALSLATGLASLLLATPSRAATLNYKVQVAVEPTNPVARFKAVLWGAAQAGTTISVLGTTVPTDGSSTPILPGPTGSNPATPDIATAKIAPDGTTIVLNVTLSSLMAGLSNLCAPWPGTGSSGGTSGGTFSYPIVISNANTPTDSALSGYHGIATASACTCAPRRRAVDVTWATGSAPPSTPGQRIPFRSVLVLDESGSMLSPPGAASMGGSSNSKWVLTTEATQELVNVLDADVSVNDQLGLVFFDDQHTAFQNTLNPSAPDWFPKVPTGGTTTTSEFPSLLAEVMNPRHPRAGSTSIGGGLLPALNDAMCFGSNDPISDPSIFLMSDGQQNTDPQIAYDSSGFATLNYPLSCGGSAGTGVTLSSACIPIYSVYFDLPATSSAAALLQNISIQSAGTDSSGAELTTDPGPAFDSTLVGMLKGSTMSFLLKTQGTLAPKQSSNTFTVNVDGTVKRLFVVLGWFPAKGNEYAYTLSATNPNTGERTNAKVTPLLPISRVTKPAAPATPEPAPKTAPKAAPAKPGTKGAAPLAPAPKGAPSTPVAKAPDATRGDGNNDYNQSNPYNIVAAVDLPASAAGTWTFQVVPGQGSPTTSVPYHLFVLGTETQLEFTPYFDAAKHAAGQPLTLNIDMGLGRKPFAGQGNSLKVSVDGPSGAIGTLLHNLSDPGGPGSPEGAATTPADAKTNNLNHVANVVSQTIPQPLNQPISFVDGGNGRYKVVLNTTQVPGRYVFHVTIDLNGPSGAIHRVEDEETQVEVVPTATQVTSTNLGNGTYNVTVLPIDPLKNYLGPGFGNNVHVTFPSGGGTVASITDPKVDGTYVVKVTNVAAGTDPPISISVGGTPVAGGTVGHPGPPGQGGGGDGGPGGGGPPPIRCSCRLVQPASFAAGLSAGLGLLLVGGVLAVRRKRRTKR